jgi:hypothetical protein
MPWGVGQRVGITGDEIPVEGRCFPWEVATMVELHRASILHALARVELRDGAAEDVAADANAPVSMDELEVHARAGPEWPRPLDKGAAAAQIDERHSVAGAQNRLRIRNHRLPESHVEATID